VSEKCAHFPRRRHSDVQHEWTTSPGADAVFGDAGNDQVFAADHAVDTITGGPAFDRLKADATDLFEEFEALLA
jgi:hypothetical protein